MAEQSNPEQGENNTRALNTNNLSNTNGNQLINMFSLGAQSILDGLRHLQSFHQNNQNLNQLPTIDACIQTEQEQIIAKEDKSEYEPWLNLRHMIKTSSNMTADVDKNLALFFKFADKHQDYLKRCEEAKEEYKEKRKIQVLQWQLLRQKKSREIKKKLELQLLREKETREYEQAIKESLEMAQATGHMTTRSQAEKLTEKQGRKGRKVISRSQTKNKKSETDEMADFVVPVKTPKNKNCDEEETFEEEEEEPENERYDESDPIEYIEDENRVDLSKSRIARKKPLISAEQHRFSYSQNYRLTHRDWKTDDETELTDTSQETLSQPSFRSFQANQDESRRDLFSAENNPLFPPK